MYSFNNTSVFTVHVVNKEYVNEKSCVPEKDVLARSNSLTDCQIQII